MKKVFLGTMLWASLMIAPVSAMAGVDVHVSIPLPPAIVFSAPPAAVVIPETYVYGFPDVQAEIFFYDGWWWRPWEGRWYRSRHYDHGWKHYRQVPAFYSSVPPNWRNDYRERRWKGRQWDHQRVPYSRLQGNWKQWERDKYWEKQHNWGVRNGRPQPEHRDFRPQPPDSRHGRPDHAVKHQGPPQHSRGQGHQDRDGRNRQDRR